MGLGGNFTHTTYGYYVYTSRDVITLPPNQSLLQYLRRSGAYRFCKLSEQLPLANGVPWEVWDGVNPG